MDADHIKSNADARASITPAFPQLMSIEWLPGSSTEWLSGMAAPNGAAPHHFGQPIAHSPTHSSPPIAYLVMSPSYFLKRARLAGGTLRLAAGAGEALPSADFAPAEAHIDL